MNKVLCTTMIKGFARAGQIDEAEDLFKQMLADRTGALAPDAVTFSVVSKALCDAGRLESALKLLETMMELKLAPDEVIFNNLLGGCLAKFDCITAKRLYSYMVKGGLRPSNVTFSILIRLYASCKQFDVAVEFLRTEPVA